jgi:hypothetical protein
MISPTGQVRVAIVGSGTNAQITSSFVIGLFGCSTCWAAIVSRSKREIEMMIKNIVRGNSEGERGNCDKIFGELNVRSRFNYCNNYHVRLQRFATIRILGYTEFDW